MDAGVVSLTIRRGRDLSGEEYEAVFYADEFKAFLKVLEGVSKFSE